MKSRPFSQVIVANDIQGLGEGGVVQKILEYDLIHCVFPRLRLMESRKRLKSKQR